MTGDVVPFKRKVTPVLWSDGTLQRECTEHVHLYDSIPGRCQCGKRLWESVEDGGDESGEVFTLPPEAS